MHILFIGLNYEPEATGIAPYTSGMVRGLVARGHRVDVITSYPHYPQWKVFAGYPGRSMIEDLDGARVRRVRHYVPSRPRTANRVGMEIAFGMRALCTRWRRPDVVVVVSPALISSALATRRARLSRIPVVTWVQDIYTLGVEQTGAGRLTRAASAVEAALLRSSARVVVIHDRFRTYLETRMRIKTPIDVIRNWSHVEPAAPYDRAATRAALGWGQDEIVVLHAGNMGAKQGLENVVRASRVAQDTRENIRFVLMGDGLRRRDLEVMDPNRHLQIIDALPDGDFQRALGAADLLLVNELAGLTEMSVPSKLTTYWATGRPVIAAVDGTSTTATELLLSGAGQLVPPDDPAELVEAVLTLARDVDQQHVLVEAGRAFRERHLSEHAAVTAFEGALRQTLRT